ncbi:O-methyltransferase [Pedobacter jejuensis]|uniref:O-methyltransferase n=1 Tax=Pedobacter jejuensis TaxID=1268550 RepID=UPI00142E28BD|nr:class I SAM-dependent methyltransferase [Pedobacter jejuensis]
MLPWIPFSAVSKIESIIKPSWKVLEIGAGMSTIWLAKNVFSVVSIEADKNWINRIQENLDKHQLKNVKLIFENRGDLMADFSNYPDEHFDFILIDGGPRDLCCQNALTKIKKGGYIYLDNSDSNHLCGNGAEILKEFAKKGSNKTYKFIDFVPGNFFVTEGLLVQA